MRVLHLIDPASPGGGACTLRLLAEATERLRSIDHTVIVIGSREHVRLAERCGVRPTGSICPMLRQPVLASRGLRRAIDTYESAAGVFDLIHAWTLPSAMLGTLADPVASVVGTFNIGPLAESTYHGLAVLTDRHPIPVLASSEAVGREYAGLGVDESQISVLPPAVNPDILSAYPRDAVRRRWGVSEDTMAVGLMSEPVNWADARMAVNAAGRVAVSGRPVRIVMHHRAARRLEAERWARDLSLANLIVVDDTMATPWECVTGLDAALLLGGDRNVQNFSAAGRLRSIVTGGGQQLRPMPGVLPMLWAMAAAVPVIAEDGDAVRGIIEDGQTGLLIERGSITAASNRIVRLIQDHTIAGRIGSRARTEVQRRFHLSAWCVRLRTMYQQVAEGRPIQVTGELVA